jgi:hypothetical protein
MEKQIILKNIYSINEYNSIEHITNNQALINDKLSKNYFVKDLVISSSANQKDNSVVRKSKSLFVEIYILEKYCNL